MLPKVNKKPKVLIINTKINPLNLENFEEIHHSNLPDSDLLEHSFKVDNDEAKEWADLAQIIKDSYYKYDGFVIIHDIDGIVYTSTALSFMLSNLGKPVIFTGGLITITSVFTDYKRNLILSLMFAAMDCINEVMILFAEKLFRANRTTKVSSSRLQPFDSPHFPHLTYIGVHNSNFFSMLRPAPRRPLIVFKRMDAKVLVIKFVPQMEKELLLNLFTSTRAKAIVLCGFGSGNFPFEGGAVQEAALIARKRKIVVAICTQVRYGSVDIHSYEAGRQMVRTGVVSMLDTTLEATIVKLKFLLGHGELSYNMIRNVLVEDLRGEVTMSSNSYTDNEASYSKI